MLNWIVGNKAIDRYLAAKDDMWYSYTSDVGKKYGVSRKSVYELLGHVDKVDVTSILRLEDNIRKQSCNNKAGVINCVDLTSGYQEDNEYCSSCKSKELCVDMINMNN
jgi:hypothetical protein